MMKTKDEKKEILTRHTNRIMELTLPVLVESKRRNKSVEGVIAELEMVRISLRMIIAELEQSAEQKKQIA